jgi:hypothetical protein
LTGMPDSECGRPEAGRLESWEAAKQKWTLVTRHSSFVIRHSPIATHHSSFVIRHSPL